MSATGFASAWVAAKLLAIRRLFFRFHKGHQIGHGFFHHPCAFYDLRQEHLAFAEKFTHHLHPGHQRALDYRQAAWIFFAGLFHVFVDVLDYALDQGVLQPLIHGLTAPGQIGCFIPGGFARKRRAIGDQPFGGVGAAVEDHVFHVLTQFRLDFLIYGQLPGVDYAHVQPGLDGMVQECRVDGLAHRVVAAKRKGHVAHAAGDFHAGQQFLDPARGLDKVHGIASVLFHAGADGQHVGIDDDVRRRHADLFGKQMIRPAGNADFVVHGYCLALLVEHHYHAGRAVAPHQAGMLEKFRLAFFQADGIDDRLALHAFQTGLDNRPVRTVDHYGHAGDVRLGGDEVEESGHHGRAVQEAFVHVNVDDVRPALDLLPGD